MGEFRALSDPPVSCSFRNSFLFFPIFISFSSNNKFKSAFVLLLSQSFLPLTRESLFKVFQAPLYLHPPSRGRNVCSAARGEAELGAARMGCGSGTRGRRGFHTETKSSRGRRVVPPSAALICHIPARKGLRNGRTDICRRSDHRSKHTFPPSRAR